MKSETILIPQTSCPPKELLVKDRSQKITLFDDYLLYEADGNWENFNDEDNLIPIKEYLDNTVYIGKNDNFRMEMFYYNKGKRYICDICGVKICFGNDSEPITESKKRCRELFDKIVEWKSKL